MKNNFYRKNYKALFLAFCLPLMSCQLLPSSSETSSISSSQTLSSSVISESSSTSNSSSSQNTSTSTSSESISSEVPSSSEISSSEGGSFNSENGLIEGTTATWPKSLIDGLFTSPSRLTIPAYVSPSPFNYQMRMTEDPFISIMTYTTLTDGATVYAGQLTAAGWIVDLAYQAMMDFVFAYDSGKTLMIFFMYSGEAMMFEISPYDENVLNEFEFETSPDWPAAIIADFVAPVNVTIPSFGLPGPYFYILPFEVDDPLTIFVRTTDASAAATYLNILQGLSWTVFTEMGQLIAVNNTNQIFILAAWNEGILSIVIVKDESGQEPGDWIVSSTWPLEQIMTVLNPTSLSLDILPFQVTGPYEYNLTPDQFGDTIAIHGTVQTGYIATYVNQMTTEGWVVKEAFVAGSGMYYAYDPSRTTFLTFMQDGFDFYLQVYTFTFDLENYYKMEETSEPGNTEWPEAAILSVYSSVPTTPIPAFPASSYTYEIREDMYGSVIFVSGSGTSPDTVNTYTTLLEDANYTVYEFSDSMGIFHYAIDAELKVIVVYGLDMMGKFYVTTRDYSEAVVPGGGQITEPEFQIWPAGRLVETFGETLAGVIPIFPSYTGYDIQTVLEPVPQAVIVVHQASQVSFSNYIGLLNTTNWTVISLTEGLEVGEVAFFMYDPAHSMMMQMRMYQDTVTLDIMIYDQTYVDTINQPGGYEYTYASWPLEYIEANLSAAIANVVPIFSAAEGYFGNTYLEGPTDEQLWLNLYTYNYVDMEVRAYAQTLINQGWDVLIVEHADNDYYSFIAVDPYETVILEFFSNDAMPMLDIYLTDYRLELYQDEVTAYFNPNEPSTSLWPSDAIAAFFPNYYDTVPAFWIAQGQEFAVTVNEDEPISYTIDIFGLSANDFQLYTSILNESGYLVFQNDVTDHAIAYDMGQQMMIEYYFSGNCLTITISYYSHVYLSNYIFSSIYATNDEFPQWLIEKNYGTGVAELFPPLVSSETFTFYTTWFMFSAETIIMNIADLATFQGYYDAFNLAGWTMSGEASSGAFVAFDPTGSIHVEVTYETTSGMIAFRVYNDDPPPVIN